MGRWEPGARARLLQAALDLFLERGFEQVTVAEIAARVGLTERTFYRYFADKREVLFDGQESLRDRFVAGVAEAPAGAPAIEVVAHALDAAGEFFPAQRQEYSRRRQAVIDGTPSLRERELLKLAALSDALAAAFRGRGVPEPQASLSAETAVSVFRVSFDRWRASGEAVDLADVQRETLAQLRALSGGPASA